MTPIADGERWKAGMFSSFLLPVCTLVVTPLVAAQVLNDPTRPPAAVFSNAPGDTGAATAPLLQSVMISPAGSSVIIGGETVKLGGKYGDARVVKITANEVVLRSASGTEILRMYPNVNLKAIGPAADTRGKQ